MYVLIDSKAGVVEFTQKLQQWLSGAGVKEVA